MGAVLIALNQPERDRVRHWDMLYSLYSRAKISPLVIQMAKFAAQTTVIPF
jgi:hypothetical protein